MKKALTSKPCGIGLPFFKSIFLFLLVVNSCLGTMAQKKDTTNKERLFKNVIRYDLSGGLLFGIDKYIVFGYERVVGKHQSFSINIGTVALPKIVSINTDSFNLSKNSKSNGFNMSADYRFYLAKENRYAPPHGLYIGPYFSYNQFTRDNEWDYKNAGASSYVKSHSTLSIPSFGLELGYQFILWKRLALDLMLIGPGLAQYKYKVTFEENIDAATKEQLLEALKQLLTQKFPGMNYVLADKQFEANGVLRTWSVGYRYIVHIGFNF